jgi:DNA-directed RNA polymerase subunit alpha
MLLYNNADDFGKDIYEQLSDRAKSCLDNPVAELGLSRRSASVLEAAGLTTVRELVAHTETDMLKYRNFGRKSLNELKQALSEMDLRFGINCQL